MMFGFNGGFAMILWVRNELKAVLVQKRLWTPLRLACTLAYCTVPSSSDVDGSLKKRAWNARKWWLHRTLLWWFKRN